MITLPLLLALLSPAHAGNEALDAVNGWAERAWGSAPTAELVAVGKEETLVYYGLPDETYDFQGLGVQEVVLGYNEDQLAAVRFTVDRRLAKEMKDRFGRASRKSTLDRIWIGETVKLTVTGSSATFTHTEALGRGATLNTAIKKAASDGATERGTLLYLDTRPGWRDLAWASAPANGMERVDGEDAGEAYYIRDTDKLSAGEYPLTSIGYGYYDNQLFSVMLLIPDYASARGIKAALAEAYGEPTSDEEGKWAWRGDRVDLTLTVDPQTEEGAVIYFYVPLRIALQEAEDAAAQDAANDL